MSYTYLNGSFMDVSQEEERVELDADAIIEVSRRPGDDTVHVVSSRTNSGANVPVKPGYYILGASMGSVNLSFVKMPETLVKQELNRLRASRRKFTLILTTGRPGSISSNNSMISDSGLVSPFSRSDSHEKKRQFEVKMEDVYEHSNNPSTATTPTRYSNPQDRTPPKSRQSSPPSNQAQAQMSDLVNIQHSLDRMRTQRKILERVKGESDKKTVKIQTLSQKVEELEALVKKQEIQLELQSKLLGDFEVAKQRISQLEFTINDQIVEAEENAKKTAAMQQLLKTSLTQEKESREKEKHTYEKEKVYLQNRFNAERAEKINCQLQVNTQVEELNHLRPQLEAEKLKYETACRNNAEKINQIETKLKECEVERKYLVGKLQSLGKVNEEMKGDLRNTRSSLASAREREVAMTKTIVELEENNNVLRIQLLDLEKDMSEKVETSRKKLKEVESQLSESTSLCDKQAKDIRSLTRQVAEVNDEKAEMKNTIMHNQIEINNLQDLLKRNKAHAQACEEQLKKALEKVAEQHQRMLMEMSKCAKLRQQLDHERSSNREWAQTRLDLLNQFCEEESRFEDACSALYLDKN